jgi:hypothetical protein
MVYPTWFFASKVIPGFAIGLKLIVPLLIDIEVIVVE